MKLCISALLPSVHHGRGLAVWSCTHPTPRFRATAGFASPSESLNGHNGGKDESVCATPPQLGATFLRLCAFLPAQYPQRVCPAQCPSPSDSRMLPPTVPKSARVVLRCSVPQDLGGNRLADLSSAIRHSAGCRIDGIMRPVAPTRRYTIFLHLTLFVMLRTRYSSRPTTRPRMLPIASSRKKSWNKKRRASSTRAACGGGADLLFAGAPP